MRLFAAPAFDAARFGSLRVGVERVMVTVVAVVTVLLMLSAIPDSGPGLSGHGTIMSWTLAILMVLSILTALLRKGSPSRTWLWCSATSYVLLVVSHPLLPDAPSLSVTNPWPFTFGCSAFACVAIGTMTPRRAIAGCLLVICGPVALYAPSLPPGFVAIAAAGLIALSVFLVLAVTSLRNRADWADAARHSADRMFAHSQGEIAREAERVRTDALIHDTVLAALLAAASSAPAREQVKGMAVAALDIVSNVTPRLLPTAVDVMLGDVLHDEAPHLDAPHRNTEIDFGPVAHVRMPENTASALLGATTQAVTNSRHHAGPGATCTVTAELLGDRGVRIVIADDGSGFDTSLLPPERLGVRVSILERVRDVGGTATIESTPGRGTTVTLDWHPDDQPSCPTRDTGTGVRVISRGLLRVVLAILIGGAITMAAIENLVVYRAHGPGVAIILGVALLPTLLKGAHTGTMRARTAWLVVGVGFVIIICGPVGLHPEQQTAVSISWYTCGIIAGATMLIMSGHRLPPIVALTALAIYISIWAGPLGIIHLGLAGELILLTEGLVLNHAISRVNSLTQAATMRERQLVIWQAQSNAYNSERRRRLLRAGHNATPALRKVIALDGVPTDELRDECRVLEQALRDEIRGRTLLNGAIRAAAHDHRRRGATVQILDDGGLDDIPHHDLDPLLHQVADHIRHLTSSRIIIRTGDPDSDTAITIVASTPDETAVALGLDTDDTMDLWVTIPRPVHNQDEMPPVELLAAA